MLLVVVTIGVMLVVGYAYSVEGLFTAALMCVNVFIAGLVAFNFWEPLAAALEGPLADTFLAGYEDMLVLVALFGVTLGLLRTVTNAAVNMQIRFPPIVQQLGGLVFGVLTGYLVAGFFLCAIQTLPWHEDFMGFDARCQPGSAGSMRQYLPPDRVWLALMSRAGAYALNRGEEDFRHVNASSYYDRYHTFDKYGSFELRYARYRRYPEGRDPLIYSGEFAGELAGPAR
jgi:hypothetical protein